jgi:hypothetical protein
MAPEPVLVRVGPQMGQDIENPGSSQDARLGQAFDAPVGFMRHRQED